MPLAYRAVPDDDTHRTAYRRLLRYAFAPERGPDFDDDDPPDQPAEFEPRGLYERPTDGREGDGSDEESATRRASKTTGRPPVADVEPSDLVVAGAVIDFRMRLRGEWRPIGGVSAVASPPEYRRRGHVSTLLDHIHGELYDRGVPIAVLWPFSHPFYARFGYGRTNDYVIHEFPPDALDAPAAAPTADDGTMRRLSADDVGALSRLHEAAAVGPLALDRSADWWRLRIFRSWTDERYVYGWTDGSGRLRSYLAYDVERNDDADEGRRLVVDYWGAVDDEAYRQLLAFLRNHDSQVSTVQIVASAPDLLDRLSDPDEAETVVKPGPMARLVDVEAALSGLVTTADERVVVRVRDARYGWNDRAFELSAADGRTTCQPIDAGARATAAPRPAGGEVTVDVDALSRLVVGARSATALSELGGVAGDDDAISRLNELLPTETTEPYLREFF